MNKIFFNESGYKIVYEDNLKINKKNKVKTYFDNLFKNMILPQKGHINFYSGEHVTYDKNCNLYNKQDLCSNCVFSWSEIGNVNILLPAYNILSDDNEIIDNIPYEMKIDKCIYRFSVLCPSRIMCVEKGKENEKLDIKWSYKDYIPENANSKLYKRCNRRQKNRLSIEEMLKYKIQLDCYGWHAFYWKCKTNCVVLRWCSPFERTFLDKYLTPNIHYFCVDETNIDQTVEYVLENPEICKLMIEDRLKIMNEKATIEKMKQDAIDTIYKYTNMFFV
jgi:hypothetical protein